VFQAAQDANVVGVVDDGLDPERPAVFVVIFSGVRLITYGAPA
jgi:hypothetical protein